jgi:AcrR family transcriptional regulator
MPGAVDALFSAEETAPRADAQRNTQRLLAAAKEALAQQGLTVTTRDLAHRAGVGLGTLYRRIPSVEALISAILIDTIDEMTADARRTARQPDEPWHAFAGFAERYVQLRASSCGLHAALATSADSALAPHLNQLRDAVSDLVQRAQETGALRTDLHWRDIPFVLASAVPPDHTIGLDADDDQWRRNLRVVLDGLRPPNADRP